MFMFFASNTQEIKKNSPTGFLDLRFLAFSWDSLPFSFIGKFDLRTGTGWMAFFQNFLGPLAHMICLEKSAKSCVPVIFP